MMFFFFKQKTAYEMRISDWSSDVCSSDLSFGRGRRTPSRNTAHWRASSVRSANSKIACGQRAPAFALFIACLGHRPVGDAGPAYSSFWKSLVASFSSLHAGSRGWEILFAVANEGIERVFSTYPDHPPQPKRSV